MKTSVHSRLLERGNKGEYKQLDNNKKMNRPSG